MRSPWSYGEEDGSAHRWASSRGATIFWRMMLTASCERSANTGTAVRRAARALTTSWRREPHLPDSRLGGALPADRADRLRSRPLG